VPSHVQKAERWSVKVTTSARPKDKRDPYPIFMNGHVFERDHNLEILIDRESISSITTHVLHIHADGDGSKFNQQDGL
jgi:hypothetical protein